MRITSLIFLLMLASGAFAQSHSDHQISLKPKDSLSLKQYFLQAHWEAHTRTFLMSTINDGVLKDDYALASGAGIGVLTKPLHGFQAGVSGFFMYNLLSSEIEKPDELTNMPNRYEIGLFDVEDPANKNDLDRLEELYLKYTRSKTSVTFGKMILNTPFFNPQDGRMRPTIEEGVWLSMKEWKNIGISGGWIWEVSPRSTVSWYTLSNSLGIYPVGVGYNGKKSDYRHHIKGNSGMAIVNVFFSPAKNMKVNLWNGFLENVMNTAIAETGFEQKKEKYTAYENVMFLHQDAINNGGNSDQQKTYMQKGSQSNAISAQLGIKTKRINTSLNYTHITGDGRYLMPREWGRDYFYTFLPRERNEGFGNVHAVMTKTTFSLLNNKMKTSVAYGFYKLPDVKNFRLNKYGMPSYHQVNMEAGYTFGKFLKGLDINLLAAWKIKQGETYGNARYVYNKVNMMNYNLVFNFRL